MANINEVLKKTLLLVLTGSIYGVMLFVSSICSATSYPTSTTTLLATDLSMNQYKLNEVGDIITKGPWVDVRAYTSFSAAIDAIGTTNTTLLIPNSQTVSASKTVPPNVTLEFLQGGSLNISAGIVTINGPIVAPPMTIFTGSGSVVFGTGYIHEIFPQWWGDISDTTINAAITAAPIDSVIRITGATDSSAPATFSGTININKQVHVDFGYRKLKYIGTGTAIEVGTTTYATIENLNLTTDRDFINKPNLIGVKFLLGKFRRQHIFQIENFTIGIQLAPTGANQGVSCTTFDLNFLTENKIGIDIAPSSGAYVTANTFNAGYFGGYNTGVSPYYVTGSYGIRMAAPTASETVGANRFIGPVIEIFETGVYDVSRNARANNYISPYMEGNEKHFKTDTNCNEILILGGSFTSPTIALDYTDGSSIANSATVAIGLDPYRPNDTIFLGRGIYAGKTQGFQNLLRNGSFEYWNSTPTPYGWDGGIQESTIVKNGTYSLKIATGGGGISQNVATWWRDYFKTDTRWVTLGGWVRSDVANGASIKINDGVSYALGTSSTVTNTWQYVMAKLKVASTATMVRVDLIQNGGNAYFDGLILTEGENTPAYSPRPLTDSDANAEAIVTVTNGTTTPSVARGNNFVVNNSAATTISAFSDGIAGQKITLLFTDANTTVDFTGTNLKGNSGVDWSPLVGDVMNAVFDGTDWYCLVGKSTLQGSITWDPPNISNGNGSTSSNITVTGAALGDFVIVAPPYTLSGLVATSYVSAANTAVIRLHNGTGGAVNLGSGTWKVKVIKN